VHAMTDVTGFGVLGHLLEMCRGAGLSARVQMSQIPLLDKALALAEAGCVTGASGRNWSSYGTQVRLDPRLGNIQRSLLCDPQTSGGLLVACDQEAVPGVIEIFQRFGFERAAVIGHMRGGTPSVEVEP
jgi:selenide, water dikinase